VRLAPSRVRPPIGDQRPDQGLQDGAGDENRTRTVSLGTSFRGRSDAVTCTYSGPEGIQDVPLVTVTDRHRGHVGGTWTRRSEQRRLLKDGRATGYLSVADG
jgi:hypothetical protein